MHRIDPERLNTRPIHHKTTMYLLRLCADLKMQEGVDLRISPSQLSEWATHRQSLERCEEPLMYYSSRSVHEEGTTCKHGDLLLIASEIIGELKLRNLGQGFSAISMARVDELERLAQRLNDCRPNEAVCC